MLGLLHALALQVFRRLPRRGRLAVVHVLAPTFTVGSMCIVERDDGTVLLVRHSYRERWGVPGGLLKRGEAPEDAARREALEEVDLQITLVGEPSVVVDADARRVDVIYRARPADGVDPDALRLQSPEIVEARWCSREDLPELQHETTGALVALGRASGSPSAPVLPGLRPSSGPRSRSRPLR
jgi:ADP-ribose pyrophosphatase YjhB (NUDIX family)